MSTWTGVLVAAPLGAAAALGMNAMWGSGRPEFYAPATNITVTALRVGTPSRGQPSAEAMAAQVGAHGGPVFVAGDDGVELIALAPEPDAVAQAEAQRLFSRRNP